MSETALSRTASLRHARRAAVLRRAERQAGVLSRRQLYAAGVTRGEVRANVRAGRWRRLHSQSVCLHLGPLTLEAEHWGAVFEAGPRAQLDGASSLIAHGLVHYDVDVIRVSVPRGARVRRVAGVDIRQTRRWSAADDIGTGVPRTSVETAAVRAAMWARSDKQASLLLTMTVQQRLTTAKGLGEELLRVKRDRRRALMHAVVLDLVGGAQSLGELEVGRECHRRGLPAPTRQSVRRGPNGKWYLDLEWPDWGVVVEVDGIHHSWAGQIVGDALRQNALSIQGSIVLRLPLLGLRVAPDAFFAQIEEALVSRGWPGRTPRSA